MASLADVQHLRAATQATAVALLVVASVAHAQAPEPGRPDEADPNAPVQEEPDPTRLDVERLPPEAIEISRDLYAHGLFVEAHLGARGFVGGVGRLSQAGFYFSLGMGYEIQRWLWVKASFEGSIHRTAAPPPPSQTSFEVLGVIGELRFQLDLSAVTALWAGGEVGLSFMPSDVLRTYGLNEADSVGLVYGGQAGVDFHLPSRHHSLGLAAGARLYPALDGPTGEVAVGIHGTAYIRYVF